jgi:DHA2 family methylenomycin A resistance protein-like MFS transporter
MTPAALSLLTSRFEDGPPRIRALGVYASAISAGFVTGALLAGLLAGAGAWRLLLGSGCPLALLGAAIAWPLRTARPPSPAADLRILRRRTVLAACAAGSAVTATGVGAVVLLTSYLQDDRGLSPLATGGAFAVFGAAAPAGAQLARRLGGAQLAAGLGLQGGALMTLGLTAGVAGLAGVLAAIAAFGLGHVIANLGAAATAMRGADAAEHGTIGGLLSTAQYLGGALGPPALGGLAGFRAGMVAGGAVALLGSLALRATVRPRAAA